MSLHAQWLWKKLANLFRPIGYRLGLLRPQVGIAVMIFNGERILLGNRRNTAIGAGCWQLAGGHLEFGETFEECAIREVQEETNLDIQHVKIITSTNNIFPNENRHYITIWMAAEVIDPTQLQDMEDKCVGWSWFPFSQLPSPLFEASGVLTADKLWEIYADLSLRSAAG